MNCKNCNAEVTQNYCSNCIQPSKIKRIDAHYITHEIQHVLHFERGIFYTIKQLLTKPGESVREFISENRTKLVKPIIFIIITSLIYSFVIHFFHIEDGYIKLDESLNSTAGIVFSWAQKYYGYANIVMGVFIAMWAKIIFRNYDYNFFEILILLCFVMGTGMLIFAFFALFRGLTKINIMQFPGIVGITYCSWAIGQFFDKKKLINYSKAFASYMLGMITSVFFVIAIGSIIDNVIKH